MFGNIKMFSKWKIFSVENILRNGKHFLLFDCVVKITSENYFSHLVLDVKNLFSKNVNPSQPPPPWTSTTHLHPHNIQIGKREKNCYHYSVAITTHWKPTTIHTKPTTTHQNATTHTTQKPPKHHHPHHHHNNKIRDQRKWKLGTKPNWGLVEVREKKWDEREKKLDQWHAMFNPALIGWRERERR